MRFMTTRTIDLEAAISDVMSSPKQVGTLQLIAVRPAENLRTVVEVVDVSSDAGLDGDNWLERASVGEHVSRHAQVTLMNSRFADAITPEGEGWELAGDQLYVDFDISVANTPPGTRVEVGEVVLEISEVPHTGCAKFSKRFGRDMLKATLSDRGKQLRLRGVNATVVNGGTVRTGDQIKKL